MTDDLHLGGLKPRGRIRVRISGLTDIKLQTLPTSPFSRWRYNAEIVDQSMLTNLRLRSSSFELTSGASLSIEPGRSALQ